MILAFHIPLMPLSKSNSIDQPVMAEEPVFLIFSSPLKPLAQSDVVVYVTVVEPDVLVPDPLPDPSAFSV